MASERSAAIQRVTWVGLAANLLLSALKLAAGLEGGSRALVADAVHSITDLTTDIAILVGIRYWDEPPDARHPYGHRRIETMVTLVIAVVLFVVGVGLIYNAVGALRQGRTHSPGMVAFVAALVSIISKEWLYRWTVGKGEQLQCMPLIANAWHHRSDALSSVPAAIAVAAAAAGPSWAFVDPVGAAAVSLFIFQASLKVGRRAFDKLIDAGAPSAVLDGIRETALEHPAVCAVHAIRTRYVGCAEVAVDLHVLVDGELSVREGHDIGREVRRRLLVDHAELIDVVVHMEPHE